MVRKSHFARECYARVPPGKGGGGKGSSGKGGGKSIQAYSVDDAGSAVVATTEVQQVSIDFSTWVLAVEPVDFEQRPRPVDEITIDSGSGIHTCPLHWGNGAGRWIGQGDCLDIKSASGHTMRHFGKRRTRMEGFGTKRPIEIDFDVADVTKALMSVAVLNDNGNTVHFSKNGSYIEGPDGDRIKITRVGNRFVLKGKAVNVKAGNVDVMPVEADMDIEGENSSSSNVATPGFCYGGGESSHEGVTAGGPNDGARHAVVPKLPNQAERERHNLTHAPHAPWCEICVAARSRETNHTTRPRAPDGEVDVERLPRFQIDYSFGKTGEKDAQITILSVWCGDVGAGSAAAVEFKGVNGHAVDMVVEFVKNTGFA